jgi:hypothetical protein
MRERTGWGKLEIDTGDKAGTSIVIELPVHEDQATGSNSG